MIAFIFIFNAFKNINEISKLQKFAPSSTLIGCECLPESVENDFNDDPSNMTKSQCLEIGGQLQGPDCDFEANVLLMSIILFLGAFIISITLKNFRNTGYLPGKLRDLLSDFSVIIAILVMSTINYFSEVETPKLVVPDSFKPTWEGRDWVVTHALIFADHLLTNPW